MLNLFSQTEHERLQRNKNAFKELMPVLSSLNSSEQEALLHKLRNSNRNHGEDINNEILDEMTLQTIEQKLAKLSEEENFNSKNRYRL